MSDTAPDTKRCSGPNLEDTLFMRLYRMPPQKSGGEKQNRGIAGGSIPPLLSKIVFLVLGGPAARRNGGLHFKAKNVVNVELRE